MFRFLTTLPALGLFISAFPVFANTIDDDGDGTSDLWQAYYDVPSYPLIGDYNGRGQVDYLQGTDPSDPAGLLKASPPNYTMRGEVRMMNFSFNAVMGKVYQIQQSPTLDGRFENIGEEIQAQGSGDLQIEIPEENSSPKNFFRIAVKDVDQDQDGLTAFEEGIIGTSDSDEASSGHPGGDAAFAREWLKSNQPGQHPGGTQENLKEVDVTWVRTTRSPSTGGTIAGDFVTLTGTGSYHQLTSWRVNTPGATPVQMTSTQPIKGRLNKMRALTPFTTGGTPLFITTGSRDRELEINVRTIDQDGKFKLFDREGIFRREGSLNPEILDHGVAHRPITGEFGVSAYTVVIVYSVESNAEGSLVDLNVATLTVDAVSGDAKVRIADHRIVTGVGWLDRFGGHKIEVIPAAGGEYRVTLTTTNSRMTTFELFTDSNGNAVRKSFPVTNLVDSKGNVAFSLLQESNSLAPLGDGGYLTAIRKNTGDLKVAVWDQQDLPEIFGSPISSLLADNELDLSPFVHGVELANPEVTESFTEDPIEHTQIGTSVATGDFNNDGFPDLAIGAQGLKANGVERAGGVYIITGREEGIQNQLQIMTWHQALPNIEDTPETGDRFGAALASGDFNGDGFADLAIGIPEEQFPGMISWSGAVQILYGSELGLTTNKNLFIHLEDLGEEPFQDSFGAALAAGDFNGDGFDELVISAPTAVENGQLKAGAVFVLSGSSSGITTSQHQKLSREKEGEKDDLFGFALAVGNFNDDQLADLAIGVPGASIGGQNGAGFISLFHGSAAGLTTQGTLSENGFSGGDDIEGSPDEDDRFGSALVAGDFDADNIDELVIGIPGHDDVVADQGMVRWVVGTPGGLAPASNAFLHPTDPTVDGFVFGSSLTAGDLDGDGNLDLVVGLPGRPSGEVTRAGAIMIFDGHHTGLRNNTGKRLISQNSGSTEESISRSVNGSPSTNGRFGHVVTSADFDNNGFSDLAVGIPNAEVDEVNRAGAVHLFNGRANDFVSFHKDDFWTRRILRQARAVVSDLGREKASGPGTGKLYSYREDLDRVHMASCTKLMTLLLVVEAIESGHITLDDSVLVSKLAAGTGGSKLDTFKTDDSLELVESDDGAIPFLEEKDRFPLKLLMAGMMNRSGNRCSVALGEHVSEALTGSKTHFLTMMNNRASSLGMTTSLFGHPAGGWVCEPKDLIVLLTELLGHPLALEYAGIPIYRTAEYPDAVFCGIDAQGNPKCNGAFTKFNTIGDYPGRRSWKGGNGGLWWSGEEAAGTAPRPRYSNNELIPWATASAGAIVERIGRTVGLSLQQTGARVDDSQALIDYGFKKIFTPDRRAHAEFPKVGGLAGGGDPVSVQAFDLDHRGDWVVTAVLDGRKTLRVNLWHVDSEAGSFESQGFASRQYGMIDGILRLADQVVTRIIRTKTGGLQNEYLTGNVEDNRLILDIWRTGEAP